MERTTAGDGGGVSGGGVRAPVSSPGGRGLDGASGLDGGSGFGDGHGLGEGTGPGGASGLELDLRSISRAALVTAVALALPFVFHALRLGHVFLPMYLPILAGACFLRPGWAALAGAAAPLVSAGLTGMPPLFPPIAVWMAVELAAMGAIVSALSRRGRVPTVLAVGAALLAGRGLYALLIYATGLWLELPAGALTLLSLLAGWPGMLLAVLAVPLAVASLRRAGVAA